jgi:hypothetical protein
MAISGLDFYLTRVRNAVKQKQESKYVAAVENLLY